MTLLALASLVGSVGFGAAYALLLRRYHRAQEAISLRDDFLSMVAHDLRTPLQSISLTAHTPKKDVAPEMQAKFIAIQRHVRKMERLIGGLLDVSRLNEGKFHLEAEFIDLSQLVQEIVSREMLRYPGACHVSTIGPLVGTWDRLRLDQVVTNILTNAMKYGRGKPISLSLENTEDGNVRLTVKDQGYGIPEEDHVRIFKRFERVKHTSKAAGVGLGLWIAYELVEAMGGSIVLHSKKDEGSSFCIELPINTPAIVKRDSVQAA